MNAYRQKRGRLIPIAAVVCAVLILGGVGWLGSVGRVPEYAFLKGAQPVVTPSALLRQENLSRRWHVYHVPGSWGSIVDQAEAELGKRGYTRDAFHPLPFAIFSRRGIARTITVQIDQHETDGGPVVWALIQVQAGIPSAGRVHHALVDWLMALRL